MATNVFTDLAGRSAELLARAKVLAAESQTLKASMEDNVRSLAKCRAGLAAAAGDKRRTTAIFRQVGLLDLRHNRFSMQLAGVLQQLAAIQQQCDQLETAWNQAQSAGSMPDRKKVQNG